MNESTLKIVKILISFFILSIIVLGGLYIYNVEFKKDGNVLSEELNKINDPDFNDLITDIDPNDLYKNPDTAKKEKKCYINDTAIESGKKITLYSRKIVNPREKCENYALDRVCDDGFLLGDNNFIFESCVVNNDCQLYDKTILKHGYSTKFYSREAIPYGDNCERYMTTRKCQGSVLLGDERYIYRNCKISFDNSCDVGGGHVLANNQSHLFYKKASVKYGEKCNSEENSRILLCSDAEIQGGSLSEFKNWDCNTETALDCEINGIRIPHLGSKKLYSKKYGTEEKNCDYFMEVRFCENGELDGQPEYKYEECYDN